VPPRLGVQRQIGEQQVRELLRLGGHQGLKQHRCRIEHAATPTWPTVQQLRPCDTQKQDRNITRPVGDELDQVQHRRFGPLQVVNDQDERAATSSFFEQRSRGQLGVGGR
jgi:hypothetical protein